MTRLRHAPRDAGGKFLNLFDHQPPRGFADLLRWKFALGPRDAPAVPGASDDSPAIPVPPDLARLHAPPDPGRVQATWIGHATFLLQFRGVNVLTDPVFSERASPVQFAGPRRECPPGVALADLPPIHAVLISHNHYDHLDAGSLTALAARRGSDDGTENFRIYAPLGLHRTITGFGVPADRILECDWGNQHAHGPLTFRCVPAHHWSSRSLWDRRATLWCGWVIDDLRSHDPDAGDANAARQILFAGDTAFRAPLFELLRAAHPHRCFDLALLPIGAYAPRWFMRNVHMDAREAVAAHQLLGARRSLGMHWGTFKLTDEPLAEPPRFLAHARQEACLTEEEFHVLQPGETIVI